MVRTNTSKKYKERGWEGLGDREHAWRGSAPGSSLTASKKEKKKKEMGREEMKKHPSVRICHLSHACGNYTIHVLCCR